MGIDDYNKAKKAAEKAYRADVAAGRYPFLPALDEMLLERRTLPEVRVGSCEIPISLIRGTVTKGRQEAFAGNFMPLLSADSEFAQKWSGLLSYQEEQGIMDPVKVYEFLGRFYVLEGNKRVSVMKYLGNPDIPAEVIRILPPDEDLEEIRVYREFLRFYGCTGQYEPMLSEEGAYERLAAIFGQDLEDKWDWRAVQRLRSAFFRFSREYREQGGDALRLSAGDAFLLFLEVYGRDSLYGVGKGDLRHRIRGLWMEYRVRSNREPTAFVRLPNVRRPRSPLRRILRRATGYSAARPLLAAFIYDGEPAQSRWLNGHETGRRAMEKRLRGRVRTRAFPGCATPEAFEAAVERAAADGAKIIFTVSPDQMKDTLRAAVRNPQIRFLNCSVNLPHSAVPTYYGRMYEVKFLLGALAAVLSEDHRIGYVSGPPRYGAVANINAFAIGAAMIDPAVQVHLTWSCLSGVNWHEEMRREDLRIVSGPDLIRPGGSDPEYGLFRYQADGSTEMLANPVWNWGRFYELMMRSAMAGAWKQEEGSFRDQALNYWWGMSSGAIGIEVTEAVPAGTRHLIDGLRKAMMAGILGPFEGELCSQEGPLPAGAGEDRPAMLTGAGGARGAADGEGSARSRLISALAPGARLISRGFFREETEEDVGLLPEEIVTMEWLHENVQGKIPHWDEMTETARRAVSAGGILQAVKR